MSQRDRGRVFAVVTTLFGAAVVCLLVVWIYETGAITAISGYEAERHTAEYAAQAEQEIADRCLFLKPPAMAECIREIVESTNEHYRSEDDLVAQTNMALWAFWMVVVSTLGAIATFFGIWFVWRTLDTSLRTLAHAEDTSKRELRAYISVVPDGINRLTGLNRVMGHVLVRNVGHIPASNVSVNVQMKVVKHRIDNLAELPVPSQPDRVQRVVMPGTEMRQGSERPPLLASVVEDEDAYIYVWGIVHYRDGFKTLRFTRFCHRYRVAGHNQGAVNLDDLLSRRGPPEARMLIAREKARYHTVGNSTDKDE